MIRKLLPFVVVGSVAWCAWSGLHPNESVYAAPAPPTYRFIDSDSVAMIDEIVTHPGWSLGIAVGTQSCTGRSTEATYQLEADGTLAYTVQGVAGTTFLLHEEMETIRALGRFPAERVRGGDGGGYPLLTINFGAADIDHGVEMGAWDGAGGVLEAILVGAVDRANG